MTTPFHGNINFNAHHSPMGAYLTFTCGHFGTRGGLAAQLGKPANQDLYIGYKNADRYTPAPLQVLPFFNDADKLDPAAAFLPQKPNEDRQTFCPFTKDQLTREYGWSTDRWKTNDGALEFSIYSPFISIPDPIEASRLDMRTALLPAITAELIIDNRQGQTTKTGFFAINFQDAGNRILELNKKHHSSQSTPRVGFAHRAHYGIIAELLDMTAKGSPPPTNPNDPFVFLRWWPHEGLEDRTNPIHLLGTTPGIGFEVPPGKRYSLRLVLACYFPEIVTTRIEGRYLYTRYFIDLLDVLNYAADTFCDIKQRAKRQDEQLKNSEEGGLSEDQQFLIAHATRSYYANTELLDIGNGEEAEPYWIVNEGEYCMMNTLDLAVDHVFWELDQNPWVVRNLLDNFLKYYSYTDQVKIKTTESTESTEPTENTSEKNSALSVSSVVNSVIPLAPGGLSFTHDQGTHNQFSPFGTSAYELKNLTGTFSYMTQEQLCNWILIAASYIAKTYDIKWLRQNRDTVVNCLQSMKNRVRLDPESPIGISMYDSTFCGTGQEITTYDSLDHSLAQTHNNTYMVIKCWSCCVALSDLLGLLLEDDELSWALYKVEQQFVASISRQVLPDGTLPAILGIKGSEPISRILPAIEALVFPIYWCDAFEPHRSHAPTQVFVEYERNHVAPSMTSALRTHTITLLSDPDHRNKFPGGGIKLSSTSDNSWLSKIAIVQHVARSLFNLDENGNARNLKSETRNSSATGWEKSDAAHVQWLTTGPGAYWCACDQIINGIAKGSKYYPRLITTTLWLRETHIAPGLPRMESTP